MQTGIQATTPFPPSPALGRSLPQALVAPVDAQKPLPCGWYDSSFELHAGLQVIEEQDPCLLQLWALAFDVGVHKH